MASASTSLRTRAADVLWAVVGWAGRVRAGMPRPVGWLLAEPHRLLLVAWLAGVLLVGVGRSAVAEPIIVGPDLAGGGPKTLFETHDFLAYKLTVKPTDEASGWFNIGAGVLQVIGFINNLILWVCLGLLYGALTLLAWFLNLTLYRDSAPQIDAATQMMANHVFWPLIAATAAVGVFLAYARWRGEGRGFVTDLGWVVAAAAIAIGFASGPSQIMDQVDGVRQNMASGIIAGSEQYVMTAGNPTGFPAAALAGDPARVATRRLVDSVWNTFGATAWCRAQFAEVSICQVAGHHALANSPEWQEWMKTLDEPASVPEFHEYSDWVRGQDMTRTGYLLLMALITVPLALMLLRLVISGLIAVVGFLLMLVIGLLFLTFWPIPGWFRQTGTRYWIYTLGLQLQALFLTVVISGVMVVSTLISTQTGKYGYFIVALLNVALFMAAVKARSWLEMLTTVGGAGAMGYGTALIARSIARTVMRAGAGIASGGLGLAAGAIGGAARMANRMGRGSGWGQQPGARTTLAGTRTVTRPRMAPLGGQPIQATASRAPTAGRHPGIGPGRAGALPAGTGGNRPPGAPGGGRSTGPGRAAAADPKLARNVQRNSPNGRVWVDKPGAGLSPLDSTPPPKSSRPDRGGSYRITSLSKRRNGRKGS